jgi:TIR domain
MTKKWDIFISHTSEDKRAVALPLRDALKAKGLSVWIDYGELKLGDDLRQKISDGLAESRFAVVILSRAFLAKQWPMSELRALMAREEEGSKVVLPVRYGITQKELVEADPLVGARLRTTGTTFLAFLSAAGRASPASHAACRNNPSSSRRPQCL